jgi:hypothetical protein
MLEQQLLQIYNLRHASLLLNLEKVLRGSFSAPAATPLYVYLSVLSVAR